MQNKKINVIYLLIFVILMMTFSSCSNQNEQNSLKINAKGEIQNINYDLIFNNENAIFFPSVVRSSGKKPVETDFKGIELLKLFKSVNIDVKNFDKFTFNGADGYSIVLKKEEILEPNNTYLVFEKDGEKLKSNKSGSGPFQLIIRNDPFSQRWVKCVNEIILE